MNRELLVEVEEAYSEVVELPPKDRTVFLEMVYGERPEIRREVETLLQYQEAAQRLSQSAILMTAAEMFADDDADLRGKVIADKYRIRERLGSGGMAEVYLADHIALEMPFALKRPRPALRADPEFRRQFLEEARRAVILKHENVARVHDVIEDGDDMFVVMEFIEGDTLAHRIQELGRPFTIDEFLPIATQCGLALVAAHEKRIVHLDVKPANIMLTPAGQVKMCDFGVARRLSTDPSRTTTTTMLTNPRWVLAGTPAYMAPEVVLGSSFDERADLFSLGTVFYEMLTGKNPFQCDNTIATTGKVVSHHPPPISATRKDFDPRLERIVTRMMAKDPAARYATAVDLVRDITTLRRARNRFQDMCLSVREAFTESISMKVAAVVVCLAVVATTSAWLYRDRLWQSLGLNEDTLMVFQFRVTGDGVSQPYADGLANMLTGRLSLLQQLDVVSMREVVESAITKPSEAFGRLGATRAITGDIYGTGERVQIVLSLIDGKSGKQLRQKTLSTAQFNSIIVENQVTDAVVALLKLELSRSQQLALRSQDTENSKAHALYVEGKGYLTTRKLEDIDTAIKLFIAATEEDSNFSLAYAGLGIAYRSRYEVGPREPQWVTESLSACDQAVSRNGNLAAGHVCLGAVYKLRGEHGRAIQEYEIARQLSPNTDEVYEIFEGLGRAQEAKGDLGAAEATYKRAIKAKPDYWYSYMWLAQFYTKSRAHYADSVKQYQEAVSRAPDNPVPYLGLCGVQILSGNYQEAFQACNTSIAKHEHYRAYINLGVAYFNMRQYSKAAQSFSRARELNAAYYKSAGHLARTYYWMGKTAEANALFAEAIRLADQEFKVNPGNASVHVMVARYHAMLGNRSRAFSHLQIALATKPEEPEYQCIAAVVHNQFGERADAMRYLERAINLGYSSTEIEAERELDNLREDPRFRALLADHVAGR